MINKKTILEKVLQPSKINVFESCYSNLPEGAISERIYKLRKCHKLSLIDFAEKVGVHCSTVKDWEDGKKKPFRSSLLKICKAFEIDISYFGG